ALAAHAPVVAAVLVTAASVLDGSDGEIARLAHRSSRFGSFFDAVLDRAADGLLFTGAAIYLATSGDLAGHPGSAQVPVGLAVAFDFDGTVADSMGTLAKFAAELLSLELGMPRDEATSRYLATAGDDFRTQLDVIAYAHPCLDEIAVRFEAAKEGLMGGCRPF